MKLNKKNLAVFIVFIIAFVCINPLLFFIPILGVFLWGIAKAANE